ncbi:hypothetical protein NKK52_02965 [Mesorhizobium sp. C277A]|uniref:hypothetical protein n=1 Tax=unclassified Mesorhizobium TaxID=325217 RepID=UPI0003CEE2CA|nr:MULTISPECIES: hypothetical protein [unclassified Mesorhizobium]ESW65305.1 hypothetical protein X771_23075 [Mesorhizobium sp. LSJC277A00]
MAFDLINGGALFQTLIDSAQSAGVRHLILSSEDFSFLFPEALTQLSILNSFSTQLIFTFNSPILRAASLWQEMVKHGHSKTLSDSMLEIRNMPGMQPSFVSAITDVVRPADLATIFISVRDRQDVLLTNLCGALNIEYTARAEVNRNNSLNYLETELLRSINKTMESNGFEQATMNALREIAIAMFQSPEWRECNRPIPIVVPPEWVADFRSCAEGTLSAISNIQKKWKTRIFGSSDAMREENKA